MADAKPDMGDSRNAANNLYHKFASIVGWPEEIDDESREKVILELVKTADSSEFGAWESTRHDIEKLAEIVDCASLFGEALAKRVHVVHGKAQIPWAPVESVRAIFLRSTEPARRLQNGDLTNAVLANLVSAALMPDGQRIYDKWYGAAICVLDKDGPPEDVFRIMSNIRLLASGLAIMAQSGREAEEIDKEELDTVDLEEWMVMAANPPALPNCKRVVEAMQVGLRELDESIASHQLTMEENWRVRVELVETMIEAQATKDDVGEKFNEFLNSQAAQDLLEKVVEEKVTELLNGEAFQELVYKKIEEKVNELLNGRTIEHLVDQVAGKKLNDAVD
ncbi:hypothetical protein QBC34DRAFT_186125 [Podospora aff. communis PSN243]|uniref:Uncharacterized protein n=1 Tax=Podospora aff. communis PSN243 TaxID=3040156 RepID=A0AAV9G833_9PEZI|nr:hypothetical protein QBC34DRAFT_186125 [Podospora aff. communis PSN243]